MIVTGIVVEAPEPVWDVDNSPIYNCSTPRGEQVFNGQFVKAYRYTEGYSGKPCEVELRLCRNGILMGRFQYPNCNYRLTTS